MIPLVSLIVILFPVPFHPVFTRYALAPDFSIFLTSSAERFNKNFVKYTTNEAGKALVAAGPQL